MILISKVGDPCTVFLMYDGKDCNIPLVSVLLFSPLHGEIKAVKSLKDASNIETFTKETLEWRIQGRAPTYF